jgi:hypothetical protein
MAFLDYLLGGVSGGFEGYERKKAKELQAQKDEEERQFRMMTLLNLRPTGLVQPDTEPLAEPLAQPFGANINTTAPKPAFDTTMGRAFTAATKRDLGVAKQPPSPLTTPVSLALDTTKGRQPAQPKKPTAAAPAMQMNIKGLGRMGFALPESEEEKFDRELKKLEVQQDLIEKRTAAANDRANRGYFAILLRAGKLPSGVTYEDVKDIDLKSAYDELKQERSLTSAMSRAQVAGQYGTYLPGVVGADGQPQIMFGTRGGSITPTGVAVPQKDDTKNEIQSGLQAMGVARASSSLNLLETNTKLMDRFEKDVLDGKAQITALQLETARYALSGGKGSAVAEDRLAKGIPGVMPPNPALLRYVRAGKGISGAVREITPRGGSNLMMQMEQTLAGIGPAGTDAESIGQVQTFRNDILAGVREGVMAMRGTQPSATGGRPPISSFRR